MTNLSTPTPGIVERLLDYSGHNVSVTRAGVRSRKVLVNPDGPEAAALLKEMAEALGEARAALWAIEDSAVESGFDRLGDIIADRLTKINAALSTYHGDKT